MKEEMRIKMTWAYSHTQLGNMKQKHDLPFNSLIHVKSLQSRFPGRG